MSEDRSVTKPAPDPRSFADRLRIYWQTADDSSDQSYQLFQWEKARSLLNGKSEEIVELAQAAAELVVCAGLTPDRSTYLVARERMGRLRMALEALDG